MVWAIRHQALLRLVWLALAVVLAACNTGSNSAPY
jgi:predicted small secreted protein